MPTYHLAIDIGASNGRHIVGWLENNKVRMQEIYRFDNGMVERNGRLCWDMETLFAEVVAGLKRCHELGLTPASLGIDTWAVDFVLLDRNDAMLGDCVAYRDSRTQGVDEKVYERISEHDLYARTGIQKLSFNTLYQLYALKQTQPELLRKACSFLMVPEYLNFLLTGKKVNEYTNATTTQLVNAHSRTWDVELLNVLELPVDIFGKLSLPKTVVGNLKPEIRAAVGFDVEVVLSATHDTASAVLAMPAKDDDSIYISSGTWSLMGIERLIPDCTEESRKRNFTNEGGYHHRYRYLKNIMGLWMLQNIRKEFRHPYSFDEINTLAGIGLYFSSTVEVNDPAFLAPQSMVTAVKAYCARTGQDVPETECEILACTYKSLARCYAETASEIEALTGKAYRRIHIIGGGCRDGLLNRLTAQYTGKDVYAGPVEATAIGNLLVQMLRAGSIADLPEARDAVRRSFAVEKVVVACS
ncbi:rhamnulokinase [Desulfosarcina ovata subsp. sediminis]|uniref:Rhamnulokinase n=1 Tax=Desulfosarcina ovata subsp. sediminis TaxID=885957 RepID=A0A5K7ZZB3_9BACT|nr:rhamnulokinase [Desulfosarcina ovata]BBO85583.1 rhamnulokinase [Desulfosarcina ovata subsp. sediminis]